MTNKDKKRGDAKFYAKYMAMAWQLFALLFLAVIAGQWLDKKLETSRPLITAFMLITALLAFFYSLIKSLEKK